VRRLEAKFGRKLGGCSPRRDLEAILIVSRLIVCSGHQFICMGEVDRKRLGKRIRLLRLASHLSQEGLAERAGLHPTYIGGIERGERNVGFDNLLKIARALGEHPTKLFSEFPK
jgi:DNA-binding XRE family transcriptional regulator